MNIQDIVKKIFNYEKIDILKDTEFTEKKNCIFDILANKYDINKNSIFESNELERIVGDLCNFSKIDDDKESLSETEAKQFLESMLDGNQTLLDYVKDPRANLEHFVKQMFYDLDTAGKETVRRDYLKKNLKDFKSFGSKKIIKNLSDEEFERTKELFSIKGRKKQFEALEIYFLAKLKDIEFERAKELFYIEGRKEQFSGEGIVALATLSDVEFERAKELFNIEGRKEQFSGEGIAALAKLSDEEFERAKKLFNIEGRKEQFNGEGIAALAKLSDEEFERAKKLFIIKGRKGQLDGESIAEISQFDELNREHAKSLLLLKDTKREFNAKDFTERNVTIDRFDGDEIVQIAKLSNKEFERAKKLFYIKDRAHQFDGVDISRMTKELNDTEFEKALSISKKFHYSFEIIPLAKLSKKEYERAENLFYLKDSNEKRCYNGKDIAMLAKLEDDELVKAKSLLNVKNNDGYFTLKEISQMSKQLTNDDIKWAKKNLIGKSYELEDIIRIAKYRNNEIEEILNSGTKVRTLYTAGDGVKLLYTKDNEIICKTFDKSGVIEREWKRTVSYPNFDNCNQTLLYNKDLKVAQVVTKGRVGNDEHSHEVELEELLVYFDEDGDYKKDVKFVKDPKNGMLNVSATDKDGKVSPIQWDSIDPDTGAKIVEKHLTSQLGVKTDFYCEDNDDIKRTEYKITKDGNTLLNLRQSFQKISDNKFISSINATNDDKNTQIYEIEYKDNNIVEIYDKKNDKKTSLDLSKYMSKESAKKLMPIIKRLPGHILLKFAEKPFHLQYGKNNYMNGYWTPMGRIIEVGNHENTIGGEDENMYNILVHELGHYLDLYNFNPKFSDDSEIQQVYKKEFKAFKEKSTSIQQKYIAYFTDEYFDSSNNERTAETHALVHTDNDPFLSTRKLYLAQEIPETIALTIRRMLEEYNIKTE